MQTLRDNNYISIGETKAIDIDYSVLYPQTSLFVNVNMLVEFTHMGQALPTRKDVAFYKLGSFHEYGRQNLRIADTIRFCLVLF